MSKLEVDAIEPQSGTTITIGASGDTVNLVGTLKSNGSPLPGDISSVVAGTGLSGGGTTGAVTINIEAAQPTITSLGTITSFRSTGIDDNSDALAITIDSSERVGIGNTSPTGALDVKSGTQPQLKVATASGVAERNAGFLVTASNSATAGSRSVVLSLDADGGDGSGTDNLTITKTGDGGNATITNQNNAGLVFGTNNAEKMRLTSTGLGILNSSPTVPLEVNGVVKVNQTSGVSSGSIIVGATATGNPNLAFQQAGTYKGYIHYIDGSDTICLNDGSGNGLHYSPTLQRLGIKTSSPSTTLDVVGNATITTADNSNTLSLVSTDADANSAPILSMRRESGSPADNDLIGQLDFTGKDSGGVNTQYASIRGIIKDVTNNTEDGALEFVNYKSGFLNNALTLGNTETVFNDASLGIDFRVESNGNANMLFVDGGNDRVGIGTNAPGATLETIGTAGNNFKYATSGTYFSILPEAANGNVSLRFRANAGDAPDLLFKNDGGSEIVRIGNTGNVGIGTANTTTAKVFIEHAGAVDDNGLYVYSNIGQTVPLVKIIQDGAGSSAPAVYIRNDDADGIALHLEKGDSGVTPHANANTLFIEDDENAGITIATPTNKVGNIFFADSGSNFDGYLQYNHTSRAMIFGTATAERMRIDSSGNLLISKTSTSDTVTGLQTTPNGALINVFNASGYNVMNRLADDGAFIYF